MFSLTYEEVLNRALARVTNTDNSEGSFLYDALSGCIIELYELYLYCDMLEQQVYADTSYGEFLDRRAEERSIIRRQAVSTERKAEFDGTVPIGSQWGKEELVYTVKNSLGANQYVVVCNTPGTIGNKYSGALINLDAISGVSKAELGDVIIAGEDEEDDESLRKRYFASFENDAFGGNVADYKKKVLSMDGVGQVKVTPCFNGAGTVKITVLTANNQAPNQLLLDRIKQELDPTTDEGLGVGLAPIGHRVTVASPNTLNVTVKLRLEYKNGYNFTSLQSQITESINAYFSYLLTLWSSSNDLTIRTSYIQSRLLDITGIEDVLDVQLNGVTENIVLSNGEIPILTGVIEIEG